jgi:arylsulfatase B
VFQPADDAGEQHDLIDDHPDRTRELFEMLGTWESSLMTVPLWGSSPFWSGQSAKQYDNYPPRPEPY